MAGSVRYPPTGVLFVNQSRPRLTFPTPSLLDRIRAWPTWALVLAAIGYLLWPLDIPGPFDDLGVLIWTGYTLFKRANGPKAAPNSTTTHSSPPRLPSPASAPSEVVAESTSGRTALNDSGEYGLAPEVSGSEVGR